MQPYANYTKTKYSYKEKIPDPIRKLILAFAFDGALFLCRYCGMPLKSDLFMGGVKWPTVNRVYHCDHIIAEALGGEASWDNLHALCEKCNLSKLAHATFHSNVHAFLHGKNIEYEDPLPRIRTLFSFFDANEGGKHERAWTEALLPVDMRELSPPHRPALWGFDEESETVNPQLALSLNLATKTRGLISLLRVIKNDRVAEELQDVYFEMTEGIEPVDFWNYVAIDLLREWDL